jgi:hypothetical protein
LFLGFDQNLDGSTFSFIEDSESLSDLGKGEVMGDQGTSLDLPLTHERDGPCTIGTALSSDTVNVNVIDPHIIKIGRCGIMRKSDKQYLPLSST